LPDQLRGHAQFDRNDSIPSAAITTIFAAPGPVRFALAAFHRLAILKIRDKSGFAVLSAS